jgi:hypothetical protein
VAGKPIVKLTTEMAIKKAFQKTTFHTKPSRAWNVDEGARNFA